MANLDFSTYVKTDPGGYLTISPNTKIAAIDMPSDDTVRVVKDYGAGFFGNFTHNFELSIDDFAGGDSRAFTAYADVATSLSAEIIGGGDFILLEPIDVGVVRIVLGSVDSGVTTFDISVALAFSTIHYCTLVRVGANLTLSIYSDSGRTTLVDTLIHTLGTANKNYQFHQAFTNYITIGGEQFTGFIQNYNLNPGAVAAIPPHIFQRVR